MAVSNFIEIVDKYLAGVVGQITDKYNDRYAPETLLYRRYLTEEYSADLIWSSAEFQNNIVAADVVSLNSSLPLKKRDTVSTAVGQIPKIGISFARSEKFLTDITVMAARGAREAEIATKILADVARAINGVEVRTEILFEQALSTGYCLVDDETTPNAGIRVNFGYKAENFFNATTAAWSNVANATPLDDLDQLFEKASADGTTIAEVLLSKRAFNYLRNSVQGKQLAATFAGQVIVSLSTLIKPSRGAMLAALEDNYGCPFTIVDSSFRIEDKAGKTVTIKPFEEANVVAVPSTTVGRLVYGTLAEESRPVADVTYAKAGSHILVAEFGETNPLREFTTAQSLCLPVIDNAANTYILQSETVEGSGSGSGSGSGAGSGSGTGE